MSPSELMCDGITVVPGASPVLRGLSLRVEPGTRAVLVGPSGAGKTTLLRAIAGLQPVHEGRIDLNGRRIDRTPPHRRRIAVVFQEPRLLGHLNVLDNVALPLRAAGASRRERRRVAAQRLEEVGLSALATRRIAGLSGGEEQRVALARALSGDPELLLLDEPLGALDPNRRTALRRVICDLQRERRVTTVIVTHDRAEAAELGDSVALMLEGRIVQHDEPRALFERPVNGAVARFFGVANLIDDPGGTLAIRPEHVLLGTGTGMPGTVVETHYAGDHVRVVVDCDGRSVHARVPTHDAPCVGQPVDVAFPADRAWRLPSDLPVPDEA